ncbi:MAG: DUF2130 domain-containing protein [Elusimicrobia bacterium]|nr:DUF2130 domain-containing protein [Elusimicrobiota bacterium]
MTDQSIVCPHCGKRVPLTEALTHPIEEKLRKEFDTAAKKMEREHEAQIFAIKKAQAEEFAGERAAIEKAARKRAEDTLAQDMKDLKTQLEEKAKLLDDARKHELALRKRQRELEERERSMSLELERKLDEERSKIREDALAKAAEEHHLRDKEKDKQLEDMRKQIEDLKRKAEQGSQQAQGEVQELELEEILHANFRFDDIEPVAKGVRGADVLQRVVSSTGKPCGSILWESKRTKAWSDGWIQKLKDDQREAKADIGIIVSSILPKGLSHFGCIDSVWVTDFPSAVGLGMALRAGILQLAQVQNALSGKGEKMELIYKYLSGSEFRHRIEAIVEAFVAMKGDLDSEKRAMERTWAKREKQIERVIHNTSGMYGDLQGLIGTNLTSIPALELSTENASSEPKADEH